MNIGLFFGTFNPIHSGHIEVAEYMAKRSDIDEVWLVASPQNPMKKEGELLEDVQRVKMVQLAIEDKEKLTVCDLEFHLPKPSYTIHTLIRLHEKYPGFDFKIIMGEDNLSNLHKWKNYEQILDQFEVYIYPREVQETTIQLKNHPKVKLCDAPLVTISSSMIREAIREQKDYKGFLPEKVYQYIKETGCYTM